MTGRLEFRVFGPRLGRPRAALLWNHAETGRSERVDTYFVGLDAARSFKLRDGHTLDLKRLRRDIGAYQLWEPAGQCELPAARAEIVKALQGGRNLPPFFRPGRLDGRAIALAFNGAGYRTVPLRKCRSRFDIGSCQAEITRIARHGRPACWTVAIEGRDVDELRWWRSSLGLRGRPNQSYPAWLKAETP